MKPQAIRKGVSIYLNGELVEKEEVIELSEHWSEYQEDFFKKMLKQGGKFSIGKDKFVIIPNEKLLNSKGEIANTKTIKSPGPDDRF